MKFTAVLGAVLAASAAVSAGPLQALRRLIQLAESRLDSRGAIYFMTNEPDENVIMSASINSDGTLTLVNAVAAGGRGLHGIASPPGPDGLFAQGGLQASATGEVLATVNPGSNTVSLFSIDPKQPTDISPLGDPVSSEGEFPMSLAFNNDGSRLCVLNGGAVASVNCFTVDKKLGLVAIPNSLRSIPLNQTTPPNGPPGTASQITFNHDESKLIASFKGLPPAVGFLAFWDVQSDGSLSSEFTKMDTLPGGSLTFSLTPIPGKNAFLSTDPGVGFTVFDLDDPSKSSVVPIPGQGATCWSTFSPKTGSFFLDDVGTGTVTEVHVDGNLKASIVKQYPLGSIAGTLDNDVATIDGKDFLFVMAAGATSVDVLALDGPGRARNIDSLDISGPARRANIPIDPNSLQGMAHFLKQ
ncbi:hypothetical protein PYCCODRAFT_1433130 [Trametes coccinea BRFM310]|uniref:Isomerase YbhE n=1 Tax=Trametes coccinea (strain BRFM310) TaxID=1353009 RepID=A0A1Y2IX52_TRAC3|nr:hypothetical protein PYCCODRAFT_1433130 [Trametes coccinea BRFM310]